MDSKHANLKKRVDGCYNTIKVANKELDRIRGIECEHPKMKKVNYMWAPGHITPNTSVCSICGFAFVKL